MATVFIPEVGKSYRVVGEWKTELDWGKRNLVLFRNLKLTGTKKVSIGSYYKYDYATGRPIRDESGNYVVEEATVNRTVPNPLFMDDNGDMVPVTVTFPADTQIELTALKTGHNGAIIWLWFKITGSSDKRFKDRVFEISVDQLNGADLEEIE